MFTVSDTHSAYIIISSHKLKLTKTCMPVKYKQFNKGRQAVGAFTELLWLELVTENSRGEMKNQHIRELISARKTSHKYANKDLSRLR